MIAIFALALTLAAGQSKPPSTPPSKPMGTFDDGGAGSSRSLKSVGIRGTIDGGGYAASANVKTQSEFFEQLVKLQLTVLRLAWAPQGLCSPSNAPRREVVAQLSAARYAPAVTMLESSLQESDDPELHQLLGLAYEGSGQLAAAAEQFSVAARARTSQPSAAVAYAVALLLQGEIDRAVTISRAAAEQKASGSSFAQLGLGAALFQHGEVPQSVDLFQKAAASHPEEKLPFEFLAIALRSADARTLASSTNLLTRLAQGSRNGSAHFALACALAAAGREADDHDEIRREQELKAAVQLDPSLAGAHLSLGALYTNREDLPAAIEEYQAALKSDPDSVEGHYRLGQLYARCGKSKEARQELKNYEQLRAKQKSEIESGRVPIHFAASEIAHCP